MSPPPASRRARELEPIVHVLCALLLSSASILLAVWTLWPSEGSSFGTSAVYAMEPSTPSERVALVSDPTARSGTPARASLSREPDAASANQADPYNAVFVGGDVLDGFGRQVPFATIWIDLEPWQELAKANARGQFTAKLPKQWLDRRRSSSIPLRVAARAAGYAPSQVLSLDHLPEQGVHLMLPRGGSALRVEAQDQAGLPLGGVRISITPALELRTHGSLQLNPMPTPPLTTDAWGVAHFEGLAPGSHGWRLEKPGYSSREGHITLVAGELSVHRSELRENASLEGQLSMADGSPPARSLVRATSTDGLQVHEIRTDANGAFLLEGLPAGPISLLALGPADASIPMLARSHLNLGSGRAETWNPTLWPIQKVHGRLLDSDNLPLAGWLVSIPAPESTDGEVFETKTDEDGGYEIPKPSQAFLPTISFFHPNSVQSFPTRTQSLDLRDGRVDDLQLDEDEETVTRIFGRVLLPSGLPAAGELLLLHRVQDRVFIQLPVDSEGWFSSPPIPPGWYVPIFPQRGLGWTPDQILRAESSEALDLGTIQLPALGRLELMTSTSDRLCEQRMLSIELMRPGISPEYRLPVFHGMLEVPTEIPLAPGDYELGFPGQSPDLVLFRVLSGGTTLLTLPPLE